MEYPFDTNVVIITKRTYTKFIIRNIDIKFNEPAKVEVLLKGAGIVEYETIEIPVETYTNWQFNQEQIVYYCKNYLEGKYPDPDNPY